MKNLVTTGTQELTNIENVPSVRERVKKRIANQNWRYRYNRIDGENVYDICDHVIKSNIGKSFDMAFHYYCTKVRVEDQHIFLDEFRDARRWLSTYLTDDDGNIQLRREDKTPKGPFYLQSDDYKTELRHKKTGHKMDMFKEVYEMETYTGYGRTYEREGKFLYYEYGARYNNLKPLYLRYQAQKEDFEHAIVQGWIKWFDSKQDPEYKRIMAERMQAKAKERRKRIKEYDMKCDDMLREAAAKRKEKEKMNTLNILAHGFDTETSFRNV